MDHYYIMENFLKNREKIKTQRAIYHKNQENFKNSKPRVQFYWSFQGEGPFVYQVIKKTMFP